MLQDQVLSLLPHLERQQIEVQKQLRKLSCKVHLLKLVSAQMVHSEVLQFQLGFMQLVRV